MEGTRGSLVGRELMGQVSTMEQRGVPQVL